MRMYFLAAALIAMTAPAMAAASPAAAPHGLSGTVISATSDVITIKTPSGIKSISYGKHTRFFAIDRASIAQITSGSFIGTAVAPQRNGTYRSIEVHIFAPALRGTGEGWSQMHDRDHHMMANSTVRSVQMPNMMANSTVRSVRHSGETKTITMTFPSGTKTIAIPADTPVIYIEPGTLRMLAPGARVRLAVVSSGDHLTAHSLLVLLHGATLPM